MGKKKGEVNPAPVEEKEGHNLLGSPTFEKLDNGRFKCVETGHELPEHATGSYAQSKHCRLGLIDSALARKKPPLNMFKQDPASRSKVICKLTGDVINKSEEHIWKHINGKRFLNMLEKKEAEKEMPNGEAPKQDEVKEVDKKKKKKSKTKGLKKKEMKITEDTENIDEIISDVRDSAENSHDMESEDEFWMPPPGERWDHDDGGDRWSSDSESGSENDDIIEEDAQVEEEKNESEKLSKKKKRSSLDNGSGKLASKKKKKKTSAV